MSGAAIPVGWDQMDPAASGTMHLSAASYKSLPLCTLFDDLSSAIVFLDISVNEIHVFIPLGQMLTRKVWFFHDFPGDI